MAEDRKDVNHPKPWKVKRYELHTRLYYIEDAMGNIVQDDFLGDETALEIVAAVNGREKLVEALKNAVEWLDDARADTERSREQMRALREAISESGAP